MPLLIDRVMETVSSNTRPSYVERSAVSLVDISGSKRHRLEVTLRPVLAPIKYADTAYVYINNTRRRYVSKTYYEPRMRPRRYAETTFANPPAKTETFVSCLDFHAEESKKWFKTRLDLKAKNFTSSYSIWPSESADVNENSSSECPYDVDENMNSQVPAFKEVIDPGASQVFIPKRRHFDLVDELLQDGQIVVNVPNGDYSVNLSNHGLHGFSDL